MLEKSKEVGFTETAPIIEGARAKRRLSNPIGITIEFETVEMLNSVASLYFTNFKKSLNYNEMIRASLEYRYGAIATKKTDS